MQTCSSQEVLSDRVTDNSVTVQLDALKEPTRFKLWRALYKPRTITEVSAKISIDRRALYYHLKILINAGLIEETESHQVRGCVEKVYKKKEVEIKSTKDDPGNRKRIRKLILDTLDDVREEAQVSLEQEGSVDSQLVIDQIKIRSENKEAFSSIIRELTKEYTQRLKELEDESGDVNYRFTLVHYEIIPEDHRSAD